jgi:hypothetical protein
MRDYYIGDDAIFSKFLITENNPELWSQAMASFFPLQVLSAVLFSILLIFVFEWLSVQSFQSAFLFLFWCKGIVGGIIAIAPAPGTLEGFLFFIPEVTSLIHLLVGTEILLQAAAVSFFFCIINYKLWKKS